MAHDESAERSKEVNKETNTSSKLERLEIDALHWAYRLLCVEKHLLIDSKHANVLRMTSLCIRLRCAARLRVLEALCELVYLFTNSLTVLPPAAALLFRISLYLAVYHHSNLILSSPLPASILLCNRKIH